MSKQINTPNRKIAVVAITRHGIALGGRIVAALSGAHLFAPAKFRAEAEAAASGNCSCYTGKTGDQIPALFASSDAIIAIVSVGAVVRLIAPHLGSKETDPAVLVIDEAAQFVIPLLSGHLGGANALAGQLSTVPVSYTHIDVYKRQDLEYFQRTPEKGLITTQEARALSLAKLRLAPDAIVWDIGAGSGSVGLEAARLAPLGHVWAIEKNVADAANARANAARFKVSNYTLSEGKAPMHLDTCLLYTSRCV